MAEYVNVNVEITPAAEKFIRKMMRFAKGPEPAFRMLVTPGGCSGYAVTFDLQDAPGADDCVWEKSGLRISSDQKTCTLLDGATLDFSESLRQTGFVVTVAGGNAECCSSGSKLVSVTLPGAK
jgi:iron-sulfur cluster assembly accessory protein